MRQTVRKIDDFLSRRLPVVLLALCFLCGVTTTVTVAGQMPVTPVPFGAPGPSVTAVPEETGCLLPPQPAPDAERPDPEAAPLISPFLGSDRALAPLNPPERPAIAANDPFAPLSPDVTAGVSVDLGSINVNLGYTLPSKQLGDFVRPLGLTLDPQDDCKRFSVGVDIPF